MESEGKKTLKGWGICGFTHRFCYRSILNIGGWMIASFSAFISLTSPSSLVGRDCGACERAELANIIRDVNATAAEDLPERMRMDMDGSFLGRLKCNGITAEYRVRLVRQYRRQRSVERDCNAGCLAHVGVNPVI